MTRRVLGAAALAVAMTACSAGPESETRQITIHTSSPGYSLEQLLDAASVVAIVTPTGKQREHWNNASNTYWESEAKPALIYRDEEVAVVEVIRGSAEPTLTVRGIGGSADGVSMTFDGLFDLQNGRQYLVFLQSVPTPTADGFETALAAVGQGQGVFEFVGSRWHSGYGIDLIVDAATLKEVD